MFYQFSSQKEIYKVFTSVYFRGHERINLSFDVIRGNETIAK